MPEYLVSSKNRLINTDHACDPCKDLLETKRTKVYSKILLMETSENNFIFLPVFYLIICLMKPLKNFGKIAILKI